MDSVDVGALQRQVTELQRKNSELALGSENFQSAIMKLKAGKSDLEAKVRNLEENAEAHGRDKEQLEKVQKTLKDVKVRNSLPQFCY